MPTRRDCFRYAAAAGTALTLDPAAFAAELEGTLLRRPIPATGELLPVIGLGSSATFRRMAGAGEVEPLTAVIETLVDNGGTVFDTAPGYGDAEEVAGEIVQELGVAEQMFWATKLNVVPRGGREADPAAARAQVEQSFRRVGTDTIDLIQVHNLRDVPTQMAILKDLKEEGRVRYIGTTSTDASEYDYLAEVMRSEPVDFIGVDYAVDNTASADTILPLAEKLGIAVLVYLPFGRSRLWQRVDGREVPDWAAEFNARTWAQFFLKFVVAHPAVTAATPATSKPHHMLDNLHGGVGPLPDKAMQQRMIDYVETLPQA